MAGFAKIAFIGEHFGNEIVNIFHFRSTEWLPAQGNPFDDSLAFLDAVLAKLQSQYLVLHDSNYTMLRAEAVGYNDSYTIVTSSPLVRTINLAGTGGALETTGSFISANIGLRCGDQLQVNGAGHSKRNRGYLSIGPIGESHVDSYGHLSSQMVTSLNAFAQLVDDTIVVLNPAVSLIPIRIHEKWLTVLGARVLQFRTYSDVKGYILPRKASVRRSRMGEA